MAKTSIARVTEKKRINIPEFDALRCIFMLVIFFHHLDGCKMFPPGGYIAVAFFFVLSGFSMTIGYRDRILQRNFSYSNYIYRRLTKFYPIHWFTLFVILILQYRATPTIFSEGLLWPKFVTNFFLLQSFVPIKDIYFSFNSPSWYLCNTVFYCFLFPYLLKGIIQCGRNSRAIILIAIIAIYILLIILVPSENRHAYLYVNPFVRILDFIFGILTGLYFLDRIESMKSRQLHRPSYYYIVICICIAILVTFSFCSVDKGIRYYTDYLYWIVYCPCILSVALLSVLKTDVHSNNVFGKILRGGGNFLQWAGKYSFTFYMIHIPCMSLFPTKTLCVKLELGMWFYVIVTLLLTMTVAVICQKFFVEPICKILTSNIKR